MTTTPEDEKAYRDGQVQGRKDRRYGDWSPIPTDVLTSHDQFLWTLGWEAGWDEETAEEARR